MLQPGDVLLSRSGTLGKAYLHQTDEPAAFAGYLVRFRPRPELNPKFLLYFTKSALFESWLRTVVIESTIGNVNGQRYAAMPVPCPPRHVQDEVVETLDRETAELDRLIEQKEAISALLSERVQAVIDGRVSGLDRSSDGRRPVGAEWMPGIPSTWEMRPIKSLARRVPNAFTDGDWIEAPFITSDGIRLVQTGNIGVGVYREQGYRYITEETFNALHCTEVAPGDVLICRLADPVGRACLAPSLGTRMITSVDVCILKPREDVDPRFVVYALTSSLYLSWLAAICRGGTRDRISRSMLGDLKVPLPPIEEQRTIADALDAEADRTRRLQSTIADQVASLRERRSALITQAVTGHRST